MLSGQLSLQPLSPREKATETHLVAGLLCLRTGLSPWEKEIKHSHMPKIETHFLSLPELCVTAMLSTLSHSVSEIRT
jgi:hypothetical protein